MSCQVYSTQLNSEHRDAYCAGILDESVPFITLYVIDENSNYDTTTNDYVDDKMNYEGYIKIGATNQLKNLSETSELIEWFECSDITDIKFMLGLSSNNPLRYGKIVFLCDTKLKTNIMYWIKKQYPSFNLSIE